MTFPLSVTADTPLDLGSGASYTAKDVYYPIKGLVAVNRKEGKATLKFDTHSNLENFYRSLRESSDFVSEEAQFEALTQVWIKHQPGHSGPWIGSRSCSLGPNKSFTSSLNAFDYLMTRWKGNDWEMVQSLALPVFEGFSHREFKERGQKAVSRKVPQLTVPIDPDWYLPPMPTTRLPDPSPEPPAPSSRTKKSFVFPAVESQQAPSNFDLSVPPRLPLMANLKAESKESAVQASKKSVFGRMKCWGKRKRSSA